MQPIQFETRLTPGGTIQLPEEVRRRLGNSTTAKVRVSVILVEQRATREPSEEAWAELARIPEVATEGGPPDGAANHDRYLYDGLDEGRDG